MASWADVIREQERGGGNPQQPAPSADPRDTDGDGSISWEEQTAYQARVDAYNERQRVSQTISAITGQPATPEQIAKYAGYDPAMLQVELSREMALKPAKGTYAPAIGETIKGLMGREATASELAYFGKQMEQGNLDTYGLESFIKGTEEYQTGYTKKAREELKGELSAQDTEYLEKIQKPLAAKYAAQGRPGAGAFGSALITAGKDLAAQRGQYLANIGYQGALGGADLLKSQYQTALQDLYGRQQAAAGLGSESRQRYYSQQDANRAYQQQVGLMGIQNAYARSQQPTFLEGLAPGLLGAAGQLGAAYVMRNRRI